MTQIVPDPARGTLSGPLTVTPGYTLNRVLTITTSLDAAVTSYYAGTEILTGSVRMGRSMAASGPTGFTFTPTWATATNGTVNIILTSTQTTGLAPGQYLIQLGLTDSTHDGNVYDIYEGFLTIDYAVGTDSLPTTYCTFSDMLTYAPWIQNIQSPVQTAGFVVERGLARAWLDNIIVQHSNWMFLNPQIGQPGFMPLSMFPAMINQPPNLWLREQLNNNYLVQRQNVIEITAKKSIYFACRPQLDQLNETQQKLGVWFGWDADKIASTLRAEITLNVAAPNNTDVWPSVTVDCGRYSLRG